MQPVTAWRGHLTAPGISSSPGSILTRRGLALAVRVFCFEAAPSETPRWLLASSSMQVIDLRCAFPFPSCSHPLQIHLQSVGMFWGLQETSHFSAQQSETRITAAYLVRKRRARFQANVTHRNRKRGSCSFTSAGFVTLTTGRMKSAFLSLRNNLTQLNNSPFCENGASISSPMQMGRTFGSVSQCTREIKWPNTWNRLCLTRWALLGFSLLLLQLCVYYLFILWCSSSPFHFDFAFRWGKNKKQPLYNEPVVLEAVLGLLLYIQYPAPSTRLVLNKFQLLHRQLQTSSSAEKTVSLECLPSLEDPRLCFPGCPTC